MRGSRSRHPSNGKYTPRIDVYGTLRLLDGEFLCRLIEYAPSQFAAFTLDIEHPVTFITDGDFAIKGRIMTAQVQGGEVKFKKAGCGCETPHQLRGSRGKLLEYLPIAPEELEQKMPDTVQELKAEWLQ
jgi:hypothetical protein